MRGGAGRRRPARSRSGEPALMLSLDIDHPAFWPGLEKLFRIAKKNEEEGPPDFDALLERVDEACDDPLRRTFHRTRRRGRSVARESDCSRRRR